MADTDNIQEKDLTQTALFREQFKSETHSLLISRTRYALYGALVVYPGFWFLDRVVAPGFADFFFWIRATVVAAYLVGVAILFQPVSTKIAKVISVGVVYLSALGIAIMIPYIGGFGSNYYIGILMAYFVAGLFMPWDIPSTAICGLLIIASYFGMNVLFGHASTATLPEIMQPLFFMSGSMLFTLWANREKELSRKNDLKMRMQLETANEDLKALDDAKTRFFSNVSHELRSPLMLILGPIEQLLSDRPDPQVVELLNAMESNARRLLRQVNSLLDFAKMDAGKLKVNFDDGNLGSLLESLVTAAKPMAERRGIALTISGENSVADSLLDYSKVETVAANLISNALKFTPEGGSIAVTIGQDKEQDVIWFEVADTGAGIPKDQLQNIFERFLQIDDALSRKTAGTGLGLAMVKELTELQRGRVEVDSEIGKGTTFKIILPGHPDLDTLDRRKQAGRRRIDKLAADRTNAMLGMYYEEKNSQKTLLSDVDAAKLEIQARSDNGDVMATAPKDAEKILLVEDNQDLRTFVARALSKHYNIVTAPDGQAGVEVALKEKPDLVVTDVMMPNMNGYQLCEALRSHREFDSVPIILATAEWGTDKLVKGVDVGASDYISKPFEMREMEARIKAHLRVRRLERTLEERDKRLSAIGQMTSSIVHDLRNPLNSILGFTQLARDITASSESRELIQYLDPVIEESKRLGLMIAEVLDFARGRITYLSLEPTLLKPFLASIAERYSQRLKKRAITLAVRHSGPPDLKVQLDRQRMQRVIENLIKNAEEAIYEMSGTKTEHHIWIESEADDAGVTIRIQDDGPGIPDAIIAQVFEPFTTHGKKQGTGLGLATARSLMKAQGGDIALVPKGDKGGAVFTMTIPFVTPSVSDHDDDDDNDAPVESSETQVGAEARQ